MATDKLPPSDDTPSDPPFLLTGRQFVAGAKLKRQIAEAMGIPEEELAGRTMVFHEIRGPKPE